MSKPFVFIAIPVHDSKMHVACVQGLTKLCVTLIQHGVPYKLAFVVGNSLIQDARNQLVKGFLECEEATDMLFIDADIGFDAEDAMKLVMADFDVIGAAYPQKRDDELMFNIGMKADPAQRSGAFEVDFIGTGFLKIRKSVINLMLKRHPEWMYGETPGVFTVEIADGKIQGEDTVFCRRWRAEGGKVWCAPNIQMVHVGEKAYRGCFADLIAKAQAA